MKKMGHRKTNLSLIWKQETTVELNLVNRKKNSRRTRQESRGKDTYCRRATFYRSVGEEMRLEEMRIIPGSNLLAPKAYRAPVEKQRRHQSGSPIYSRHWLVSLRGPGYIRVPFKARRYCAVSSS